MPLILFCWLVASKADGVVNPTAYIPLNFVAVERQSDKMVPDIEMHMKQRCVTEFFHMVQVGS